jgi:hypothetical protein
MSFACSMRQTASMARWVSVAVTAADTPPTTVQCKPAANRTH